MSDEERRAVPDLLRGNTESLILFLVNEMKSSYGYHLIKELRNRSNGFFRFKEGTVYPVLRKLENEGMISGEWKVMPNGQERRYYQITENGKEALTKKVTLWQDFSAAMNLIIDPANS